MKLLGFAFRFFFFFFFLWRNVGIKFGWGKALSGVSSAGICFISAVMSLALS